MKILTPIMHGFMDYVAVVLCLAAPFVFHFGGVPATMCHVFTLLILALNMVTDVPQGVFKLIPFRLHGIIESFLYVACAFLPVLLGFADNMYARNFYVLMGIIFFAVSALTEYQPVSAVVITAARKEKEKVRV